MKPHVAAEKGTGILFEPGSDDAFAEYPLFFKNTVGKLIDRQMRWQSSCWMSIISKSITTRTAIKKATSAAVCGTDSEGFHSERGCGRTLWGEEFICCLHAPRDEEKLRRLRRGFGKISRNSISKGKNTSLKAF
ncbi:hypothetical protein BB776_05680 [Planococcus salinarum]|uniref:Uncharacterized protein n=1 Tax=Planococcus salinarum TaxID=622695 RepID=A0ABX3D2S3_9BACL|nr:hypothetical protein BB776_05680 [Planococcus salinarum]